MVGCATDTTVSVGNTTPVAEAIPAASARRDELLELAYRYVLEHGLVELSLRPLAAAIGSSPRVLLFLFGSKEGLVLARLRAGGDRDRLAAVTSEVWRWLSSAEHRGLLKLWVEAYGRSLVDPDGPWSDFAHQTVEDWLGVLARAQASRDRTTRAGEARRTLALAVLRGALLDLLATGDVRRTTAAVERGVELLRRP
jgi:AcrR family transcriptional regulator